MNNKLMAAVVVATLMSLGTSLHSLNVASATSKRLDRDIDKMVLAVSNTDRLISLVESSQTNQTNLAEGWNDVQNQIVKEVKTREALQAMVEQNAKELVRITGDLERDYDKMYTNIVMFGVGVFAAQENITALAVRIQDLERRPVAAAVPAVPSAGAPEDIGRPKFRDRFSVGEPESLLENLEKDAGSK